MGLFGGLEKKIKDLEDKAKACLELYEKTGKKKYQQEAAAYYELAERERSKQLHDNLYRGKYYK